MSHWKRQPLLSPLRPSVAGRRLILAATTALVFLAVSPAGVMAAAPPLLWQLPESGPSVGEGLGGFEDPDGLASDPTNGHLYVADARNNRIDEFTAWGEPVRTFGWGVVASGPDNKPQSERQEVTVSGSGGSFNLALIRVLKSDTGTFEQVTSPIEYHASAASVQTALEGLEGIDPGDVAVSGSDGGPWTIEFTGRYADTNVFPLVGEKGTLNGAGAGVTVKTLQDGGNYEVCEPARGDTCKSGTESGTGAGDIVGPSSVAVDAGGDVYVFDQGSRVEKFTPSGQFLLTFGGEVDETTGADICTRADEEAGDVCGAGTLGGADGQFANGGWQFANGGYYPHAMAVGPDGTVFVSDVNRIEEFTPEGLYKGQIGLPAEGEVKGGAKEGKGTPESIAVDSSGNLYLDFVQEQTNAADQPNVYRHNAAGWSLFAEVEHPQFIAMGVAGDLYVTAYGEHVPSHILEFGQAGEKLRPNAEEEASIAAQEYIGVPSEFYRLVFGAVEGGFPAQASLGLASIDACGIAGEDVYEALSVESAYAVRAFGPPPDPGVCPPPPRAPSIGDQFASSVAPDNAEVRASINPHFWQDTKFEVEYGTAPCALGGCAIAGVGSALGSKANLPVTTSGVFLSGLAAGTTYHYRFVAESGGGGPVRGVGGAVGVDGAEGLFTTEGSGLPVRTDCATQAFRTGPSVSLPDCRAYELVSPVDKEGGDIVALDNITGYRAGLYRSASSGEKLTYSTYRAFGDSASGSYTSQYIASRNPVSGWSSRPISPSLGHPLDEPGDSADSQFKIFSPDLCQGWLRLDYEAEPTLDPAAVKGYPNLYRDDLCGEGGYEALTTVKPPHQTPLKYAGLEVQGVSADGSHAVFVASDNLTPQAPAINDGVTGEKSQLYEVTGGALRFVCVLPDGTSSESECSAGRGVQMGDSRSSLVSNAMSADGSRVYWSSAEKLYLRINAYQPQSAMGGGKCTEKQMACTVSVSERIAPGADGEFWAASTDGSRAIFTSGSDLYEYEASKAKVSLIAEAATGVMGTSEDASKIYFTSTDALAAGAIAGEQNLYFRQLGDPTRLVGVLSGADAPLGGVGPAEAVPSRHVARVSPDGLHAVFLSHSSRLASLTAGYDNVDQGSGEADDEVYVYDATANQGTGALACVSCNPTGARPVGRDARIDGGAVEAWAAAWIPSSETNLYASRVLTEDGDRVFFNSYEGLVSRDTNGSQDVYEWESSDSQAGCEEKGAELYVRAADGCISLISSGTGFQDSEFLDASPTGDDVFFTTGASLLPQDPGLVDIYDARVNGGIASTTTPEACEGEACQNPPAPPAVLTPASFTFSAPVGSAPSTPSADTKAKTKAKSSRALLLAQAIKQCHRRHGPERRRCEASARKRYATTKRSSKQTRGAARARKARV